MAPAAECTIAVKASKKCPMTHHRLVSVFEEAGVPLGVVNMIQKRREAAAVMTEALISNKAIRKTNFIGSQAVGRGIRGLCSKYLKSVPMESGGKGSAVVLDGANLG